MVLPLLALAISAATPGCWVDPRWDESAAQYFPNITYGSALDVATGKVLQLTLDAYFPPANDTRKFRPVAVLVHGGSFCTGNDRSDGEPLLARKLVARGYVAVSINYRLDGVHDGLTTRAAALAAVEDAKAAVRYVRSVSADHQIDPTRVAIMGDSAGAVTSLYVGYATAGQHGHSGTPGVNDSVQMVVPISGEMKDQAFCKGLLPSGVPYGCQLKPTYDDTKNVTGPPQPPLLMVHGTNDLTVPYINGKEVADRASSVGLTNRLITIPGAGHVPFGELWASTNFTHQFFGFLADNFAKGAECPV
jgi:acetyl esterase/lipase